MEDVDELVLETRDKLFEAQDKATTPEEKQHIQDEIDKLIDLKQEIDFERFQSKAAALKALSARLEQTIGEIRLNIDNFLLDDLLKLKRRVDGEPEASTPT